MSGIARIRRPEGRPYVIEDDRGGESDGPLWAAGGMVLRLRGMGREPDRVVRVDRPFALIGQAADCDVCIRDRDVSPRHAYLHLDARGAFAVDLATRLGTRIDGADQSAGWLAPGRRLEVAGREVELLEIRLDGRVVDPPPCDDDPLADLHFDGAVGVTLESEKTPDGPWSLDSELVFLGWSGACAIRVKDRSAGKVHCALVRTRDEVYAVNLLGRGTRVEDRPVRFASILRDGETLTIGSTPFRIRMGPASPRSIVVAGATEPAPLVARVIEAEVVGGDEGSTAIDRYPAESQRALMAWVVETIRDTQGLVLRQQGEVQDNLAQLLRQVQQDSSALLNVHLERIEKIDRELAALRAELASRERAPSPALAPPPSPAVAPLRVARNAAGGARSEASASWLIDRVRQLESENRNAWKDLLGRVPDAPRRAT